MAGHVLDRVEHQGVGLLLGDVQVREDEVNAGLNEAAFLDGDRGRFVADQDRDEAPAKPFGLGVARIAGPDRLLDAQCDAKHGVLVHDFAGGVVNVQVKKEYFRAFLAEKEGPVATEVASHHAIQGHGVGLGFNGKHAATQRQVGGLFGVLGGEFAAAKVVLAVGAILFVESGGHDGGVNARSGTKQGKKTKDCIFFLGSPKKKNKELFLFFQHKNPKTQKKKVEKMTSLADQLIQAMQATNSTKMCITAPAVGGFNGYQPAMQFTVEFIKGDDSAKQSGEKRRLEEANGGADGSSAQQGDGKRRRTSKTRRSKNKVVDFPATLDNYVARIRALPKEEFEEFANAYLTDYKLHTTNRTDSPATTHVYLLAQIAEEHGYKPRGFVSSNKKDGKYIEALPDGLLRPEEGGTAKLVYVGDKNQFTGQTVSKWSLRREDKVIVTAAVVGAAGAVANE